MLINKLKKYTSGDVYPMHMPGHKRNPEFSPYPGFMPGILPYGIDITEIPGFDDLGNPRGVLLETSKLASALYKSREAFLLVNGSTAGILAAIGAHTKRGGKILADAGCHRSVANAAKLFGLQLSYITPGIDESAGVPCSVMPAAVSSALRDNPDIRLVVITSPGYEGVISSIAGIAEVVHKAGALLLVDCAHGAHLGFSDKFPGSPVTMGADISVVSLHKTLPALTQCSLLHICSDRADSYAVSQLLNILQTSSPSYVLMASIDYCLRLLEDDAERLFDEYAGNLGYFKNLIRGLNNLSVLGKRESFFDLDPGKIVIITKNTPLTGIQLSDTLRGKYGIELERACPDHAIAMTSICDTREGFARLAGALLEIDKTLDKR